MATLNTYFGDVPVAVDYEIDRDGDVELESVMVGEIDIISGLSKEQLESFERACYWHDANKLIDEAADYYDFHRRAA